MWHSNHYMQESKILFVFSFFKNNISDGSQNSGITNFCVVLHPEDRMFVVDYFYNIHKEIY